MTSLPLSGKRVIITRPQHQAISLTKPLEALGAEVVQTPVIRIEPPEDLEPIVQAITHLDSYDWIIFTSVNGVHAFLDKAQVTVHNRIAAIGPATAEALENRGLHVSVLPERFVAESLFDALEKFTNIRGQRFLLPRADIARETLPNMLQSAGASANVIVAYRTVTSPEDVSRANALVRTSKVDAVTFTSGSTVRSFFSEHDEIVRERCVPASIGPITSKALRELQVEPIIEAKYYSTAGLVDAIHEHFSKEKFSK